MSGSFLTYREMEGKRGGSSLSQPAPKRASAKSPEGSATGDSEGEGPDGYRYKPDGLMKQSFSITTSSGQHLHLISYYSRSNSIPLQQPSNDSSLRHIRPPKNMYPESTVNETQPVAAVTRGPLPGSPYAQSPHPHQMPTSPYSRPGPPQTPVYVPVYGPPTPPTGHAYYGQPYPYFQYAPVIYAPGYHPQQGHVFDRPPQLGAPGIPHPPPGHIAMAPHPGHPPPYMQQPPPHLQRPELVQRHSQPAVQIPPAPPAVSIPEQGPQLPAINNTTPTVAQKPPTPQPESQTQNSLAPPETNGAANEPTPARTIPKIGSILNNHEQSTENQSNSRSGSRSPNGSQPAARELPPDRLASMSTATDTRALDKLNRNMFVRT